MVELAHEASGVVQLAVKGSHLALQRPYLQAGHTIGAQHRGTAAAPSVALKAPLARPPRAACHAAASRPRPGAPWPAVLRALGEGVRMGMRRGVMKGVVTGVMNSIVDPEGGCTWQRLRPAAHRTPHASGSDRM